MRFDARSRRWVEDVVGARVTRVRRLHGGVASVIHRVETGRGPVILRRVSRPATATDDPADDIVREAGALRALAGIDGVPHLLAADPWGTACGVPASAQTCLPGRPDTGPRDLPRWLDALAVAVALPSAATVDLEGFEPFQPWFGGIDAPPPWATVPQAWTDALAALRADLPPSPEGLLHRDVHPGNVLVDRAGFSGLVDWTNACRGPIAYDLAKCRVEVGFLVGAEAADELLRRCAHVVPDYDRRWDAVVSLELGHWTDGLQSLDTFGSRLDLDEVHRTLDQLVLAAWQ